MYKYMMGELSRDQSMPTSFILFRLFQTDIIHVLIVQFGCTDIVIVVYQIPEDVSERADVKFPRHCRRVKRRCSTDWAKSERDHAHLGVEDCSILGKIGRSKKRLFNRLSFCFSFFRAIKSMRLG